MATFLGTIWYLQSLIFGAGGVAVGYYFGHSSHFSYPKVIPMKAVHPGPRDKATIAYIPVHNPANRFPWKWVKKNSAQDVECYVTVLDKQRANTTEALTWQAKLYNQPYESVDKLDDAPGEETASIPFKETKWIPIAFRELGTFGDFYPRTPPPQLGGENTSVIKIELKPSVQGGIWYFVLHARGTLPTHFQVEGPFKKVQDAQLETQSLPPWSEERRNKK